MTTPTKICKDCGIEYPATPEFFTRTPDNSSGLNPRCKTCRKAKRKIEYANNPEQQQKAQQRVKDHRMKDPEKTRENRKLEAEKASKKTVQRVKEWRKKNPEKYKESWKRKDSNRRARHLKAEGKHTKQDIKIQFDKQGGLCYWCSQDTSTRYHVDHVIPLSRGGSNYPENLVIACKTCNQKKTNKMPYTEWIPPKPLIL